MAQGHPQRFQEAFKYTHIPFFFPGTDGSYFPACPVAGEYSGRLTDNPNLCAKLSSNCNKLDVMFFVITPCDKITDIIEGM